MPEGQIRWYRVLDTHGDYAAVKTYLQGKLTEKYPNFTATEIAGATANHQIIQSYLTDAEVAASPVSLTPSSAGAVKEAYDFSAHHQVFDMSRLSMGEGPYEDSSRPNDPDGDDLTFDDTPGIRDYCNPAELIRLREESTLGTTKTIFYVTYDYDGRGLDDGSDYLNARGWKNVYGNLTDDLENKDVLILDGGTNNFASRKWNRNGSVDKEARLITASYISSPLGGLSPADSGHVTRHPSHSNLGPSGMHFIDDLQTWSNVSGDEWNYTWGLSSNLGSWGWKPTSGSFVLNEETEYTFYERVSSQAALDSTPYSFWQDGTTLKVNDPDGDPEAIHFFGFVAYFNYSSSAAAATAPANELATNVWTYHELHGIGQPGHEGSGGTKRGQALTLRACKMPLASRVRPNHGYQNQGAINMDGCFMGRTTNAYYSAGSIAKAETVNSFIRGSYIAHQGDETAFHGTVLSDLTDSHQVGGQGVDRFMVLFNRMVQGGRPINLYGFDNNEAHDSFAHDSVTQKYEHDTMYMSHPQSVYSSQRMKRVHIVGNVIDHPRTDFTRTNQGMYVPSGDNEIQATEGNENYFDWLIHANVVQGCDDFAIGFKAGPWDESHAELPMVSRNLIFVEGATSNGIDVRAASTAVKFPNATGKGQRWSGSILANTVITTVSTQYFLRCNTTINDTTRTMNNNVYKGPGKWWFGSDDTTLGDWQANSSAGYTFDPNGKHIS